MSQHDYSIANASRTSVRVDINNAFGAVLTQNSGSSAPSTTGSYMTWADTTSATVKRRNAADSGWIVRDTLDETLVLGRTSNTILDISDFGKLIRYTSGTFSQTFDAAATLGDGWNVELVNEGTGTITLDPNSSETINGASTLLLYPTEAVRVFCNGTALFAIKTQRYSTGSWTPADGSGAALTFSTAEGSYIKQGQLVNAWAHVIYPSTASGATAVWSGLPFTALGSTPAGGGFVVVGTVGSAITGYINPGSTTVNFYDLSAVAKTNANFTAKEITMCFTYLATN